MRSGSLIGPLIIRTCHEKVLHKYHWRKENTYLCKSSPQESLTCGWIHGGMQVSKSAGSGATTHTSSLDWALSLFYLYRKPLLNYLLSFRYIRAEKKVENHCFFLNLHKVSGKYTVKLTYRKWNIKIRLTLVYFPLSTFSKKKSEGIKLYFSLLNE